MDDDEWKSIKKISFFVSNGEIEFWVVWKTNGFMDIYLNNQCIVQDFSTISDKEFEEIYSTIQ